MRDNPDIIMRKAARLLASGAVPPEILFEPLEIESLLKIQPTIDEIISEKQKRQVFKKDDIIMEKGRDDPKIIEEVLKNCIKLKPLIDAPVAVTEIPMDWAKRFFYKPIIQNKEHYLENT